MGCRISDSFLFVAKARQEIIYLHKIFFNIVIDKQTIKYYYDITMISRGEYNTYKKDII